MRLSNTLFERVHSETKDGFTYSAIRPKDQPMILFSKKDGTALASLHVKCQSNKHQNDQLGNRGKSIITKRPYNSGFSCDFQAILSKQDQEFELVITNLTGLGMINFNIMKESTGVTEVNPGGLNEVNELHEYQSYSVQCDQSNNGVLILKSIDKKVGEKTTKVTVANDEAKGAPEGTYYHLSVVPQIGKAELISLFEDTVWACVDMFVTKERAYGGGNYRGPYAVPAAYPIARGDRLEYDLADLRMGYPIARGDRLDGIDILGPASIQRGEVREGSTGLHTLVQRDGSAGLHRLVQRDGYDANGVKNIRSNKKEAIYEVRDKGMVTSNNSTPASFMTKVKGFLGIDSTTKTETNRVKMARSKGAMATASARQQELVWPSEAGRMSSEDDLAELNDVTFSTASAMVGFAEEQCESYTPQKAKSVKKTAKPVEKKLIQDSLAGKVDTGRTIDVMSSFTGIEYNYETASAPCVIGLSISDKINFAEPVITDALLQEAKLMVQQAVEKGNQDLLDRITKVYKEEMCMICLDDDEESPPDTVFYQCGHQIVHRDCCKDAGLAKCPMCRAIIVASIYVGVQEAVIGEEKGVEGEKEEQKKEVIDVFEAVACL